jgi:hypothetical protein
MAHENAAAFNTAGRKFDQSLALVVLRHGNAIDQAKVLEPELRINTEDLGTLHIPIDQIKTVILNNLPSFPLDVIRLFGGNEISGTVLTDPVHLDSQQVGGAITIPLAKILSIVF